MKTLYEILEVSENASKEVLDKAYKVLAKKYHPDLQMPENKSEAEKKMKEINEAYDILSDDAKRKEYDDKLKTEREEIKRQQTAQDQNNQQTYGNTYTPQYNNAQNSMSEAEYRAEQKRREEALRKQQKYEQELQKNMQAEYEQKYQNAYENYLRSLGYKIKHKWTWKNYKDFLIAIAVIIVVCLILWFFPPTHNWLVDIYNSNAVIKMFVDIIGGIITGIWNAICSIFTGEKIL